MRRRWLYKLADAEVDMIVRWECAPWRIAELRPVPQADWTDEETATVLGIQVGDALPPEYVGILTERGPDYAPWYLTLEPIGKVPAHVKISKDGRAHLRGRRFGRNVSADPDQWDVLDTWPRVGVCQDCGFLWPCPDELSIRDSDRQAAEMAHEMSHTCAHCGQLISTGSMMCRGTVDTPDGPADVVFHTKKGGCRTAAIRWANERGKRWYVRDKHDWWNPRLVDDTTGKLSDR